MQLNEYEQKKIKTFIPQSQHMVFDCSILFEEWLKKTTEAEIIFEDSGQDLIRFYVSATGEIIHTELPTLGRIYNGSLVLDNLELITSGDHLTVWVTQFKEVTSFKYMVRQIIRKKNEDDEN